MKSVLTKKMSEECTGSSDEYDYVPPEGGWGYLICVGVSVIFVSIFHSEGQVDRHLHIM